MSFLVRPLKRGFRVIEETYSPIRKVVTVPVTAYASLGFRPDMSLEEAKARASQINKLTNLQSKKISASSRRVELLNTENKLYLPASDVERFETELSEMYADNPYRHEITLRYWRAAQLLILELGIDPKDFRASNHRLINLFKKRKWSHDYIKRITRILNMWGACVCRHRGSLFEPLPKLSSIQVQSINDKRDGLKGVRTEAVPLSWTTIKNKRTTFENDGLIAQWNWLKIAAVFGLRGLEVDNLKKGKQFGFVKYDSHQNVQVLMIYQTKLVSVSKEHRWKPIPVVLPEQKEAVLLIHSGEFKRPLHKTLHRIFGDGIQTHSPRKAFTDYMLDNGFQLEDISTFMGHHSIDMTWRKYKSRRKFNLPKSG
jgi:integrase